MAERSIAIIGGGPAGLMAADTIVARAAPGSVTIAIYDAMPSTGRKFLLAGKGGLNITHTEPLPQFLARYGARQAEIAPMIGALPPAALRDWVQDLGIDTFEGSSGRVFPAGMKAAPLLRAWLHRLRSAGVRIHARHRWTGWRDDGALMFDTPQGPGSARADATVLAMGGGSWPQLGSNGAWVPLLADRGIPVTPLAPSNCGFDAHWSTHFRTRYAGAPVKPARATFTDRNGVNRQVLGEFIVTEHGVEGGIIYALSALLRDEIAAAGQALLRLDLAPDRALERLVAELAHARGRRSLASHIQSRTGLKGVKVGLLRECVAPEALNDPPRLAAAIKAVPLQLFAARPIAEAISSAGGVRFDALDSDLMLRSLPGVFCAGEMLDWEAPTGGYLLTACFATGRAAGWGALRRVTQQTGST